MTASRLLARFGGTIAAAALALFGVLFLAGALHAANPEPRVRVVDPLPITILSEPRYHRVAGKIEEICRDEVPRLASELGLSRMEPVEIIVTDDVGPYDDKLGGDFPEWGIAFAILEENRILVDVQRATRQYNSLDEVVPHELSHLLVHQRAPGVRFPIWFLEGLYKDSSLTLMKDGRTVQRGDMRRH